MNDTDLLALVASENERAIGLDQDEELSADREQALNYAKGVMTDVPSLANRSKAVSTDVADAVETVLPDLIEMFTGGEDVASFSPRGPEDEEGAAQETDYLYHVLFNLNDGFGALYAGFKDALLVKTGVWTFWWDEDEYEEEEFEGSPVEFYEFSQNAERMGVEIVEAKPMRSAASGAGTAQEYKRFLAERAGRPIPMGIPPEEWAGLHEELKAAAGITEAAVDGMGRVTWSASGDDTMKWTVRRVAKYGCARFKAVPPEDFAVARDTVHLRDATYCVMRSRPRAQDLIADGYDKAEVDKLPAYVGLGNDAVAQARDSAGESEESRDGATHDLRTVEILHHCIKVVEQGKPQFYSIVTDRDCSVILDKDKIERVCFAAVTPYPVAHRFFGESLADKLIQIQQIKTVLVRMLLDSGYFAMNQRTEVAVNECTNDTISDLMANEPGRPIRTKTGNGIKPISAGQLGFDVMSALEYVSTLAEERTGVVRNAQGLNPDTLHDTAKGAMALMTQAQKRIRLIARIFAETGLKDLFLGLHQLTRTHSTQAQKVRLRGEWQDIDPTSWGSRDDMTIEIGVGAGGREQELLALQGIHELVAALAQHPAGQGMVTPQNLYNLSKKTIERAGFKAAEQYITDPSTQQQQPPPPDPELIKIQQQSEVKREEMQLDAQLKREQMAAEIQLKREQMAMEAELEAEKAMLNARVARENASERNAMGGGVRFGGAVG